MIQPGKYHILRQDICLAFFNGEVGQEKNPRYYSYDRNPHHKNLVAYDNRKDAQFIADLLTGYWNEKHIVIKF